MIINGQNSVSGEMNASGKEKQQTQEQEDTCQNGLSLEDLLTTDFAKAIAACLTYFEGESFPYLEFLEGGDKNSNNIEYEWKVLKNKDITKT